MISKNKLKLIHSLALKKYRTKNNLFLVEGNKLVEEILASKFEVKTLIGTVSFLESIQNLTSAIEDVIPTSQAEIDKASLLKTPQQSLAVCTIPEKPVPQISSINDLCLCLDGIQDPGNLGTIIRIADWYGIRTIFASPKTVDIYNPKAVQATMGAITRVNIYYLELEELLGKVMEKNIPVYGSFLEGENIYAQNLKSKGLIIMGNEGNGISSSIEPFVTNKILIPGLFSEKGNRPDSLNVSMATAIICSEFRREKLRNDLPPALPAGR